MRLAQLVMRRASVGRLALGVLFSYVAAPLGSGAWTKKISSPRHKVGRAVPPISRYSSLHPGVLGSGDGYDQLMRFPDKHGIAILSLVIVRAGGQRNRRMAPVSAIDVCPGEGPRYGDFKCNHDGTHRVCAQLVDASSRSPLAWGSSGSF